MAGDREGLHFVIYRCRNALCAIRLRYPAYGGVCKNCGAPMSLVDEEYDDEDAIRDGVDDILEGFSRLLMQNDVAP